MKWYLAAVSNYYGFSGRAGMREFWMFMLFNMIFAILAIVLDNLLGTTFDLGSQYSFKPLPYGYIYLIYAIAVFIPGNAVLVRRLHDVGQSGWMIFMILIPVIGVIWLLYMVLHDSYPGRNVYGPQPQ